MKTPLSTAGGSTAAVPPSFTAEMYIRQAGPDTYRQVLRDIRQKEIYKLIVDTSPKHMSRFFRAVSMDIIIFFEKNVQLLYCGFAGFLLYFV